MSVHRRDFIKLSAGALIAAGATPGAGAAHVRQGRMILPEHPTFRTKHLITVLLGGGARKRDFVDDPELAPHHHRLMKEATVFTRDHCETADLHGYMYSELLTGRAASSQRPLFPTWNEYVRKKTGARASDFWVLQPASYYGAWTWDVKHFSRHPDYGPSQGATSLTMNKIFGGEARASAREFVARDVEASLGHAPVERRRIEEFLDDARKRVPDGFSPTRAVQTGDLQALWMAGELLRAFAPKMITVQVLGLDDAHTEFGLGDRPTGYVEYARHVRALDELLGRLWEGIRTDPYFRETTALVIRPDCGRDDAPDRFGRLGHTPGDPAAHTVWTTALGPDFERGRIVDAWVDRRDLAPSLTYLMSGEPAEQASGHVRTQMFRAGYRLPPYARPTSAVARPPMIDWGRNGEARRPPAAPRIDST